MAVLSVVALVTAVVSACLQIRTWRDLETDYGLLVLAKIILLLPLLALGAYNNPTATRCHVSERGLRRCSSDAASYE